MDGGTLSLSPGGSDSGLAMESTAGGGGTGGNTGRGPNIMGTSNVTGEKYRGLADGSAVHIKWDGAGGTGIA